MEAVVEVGHLVLHPVAPVEPKIANHVHGDDLRSEAQPVQRLPIHAAQRVKKECRYNTTKDGRRTAEGHHGSCRSPNLHVEVGYLVVANFYVVGAIALSTLPSD
mmetsp:Transcript_20774/g.31458  ORF Transcript_20774/g.31458 Transcript_20774/m.31458 type:complete len:104 (-) Transcript_20774:339-650(-)